MTSNELKDKILKIIQARRKVVCTHQNEVINLLRDYFTEELTDVTYINSDDDLLDGVYYYLIDDGVEFDFNIKQIIAHFVTKYIYNN